MKQLTTCLLKFNFKGLALSDIAKIEFAFSQNIGEPPLKIETYPGENVTQITSTSLGVKFTPADTELFKAGQYFYADTRIHIVDGDCQPETAILKLKMNPTLFEKA